MDRLESGDCDGAWIFELSRFARRAEDGLRLLRIAQKGLILIDSEGEYDLTRPKQAKNFRDAISTAEYESDMISLRTQRGKRHKARELGLPNVSTRAFGFEPGGVEAREDEAVELRRAADQLLSGIDQWTICRNLNARGVRTALGNDWKPPASEWRYSAPAMLGTSSIAVMLSTGMPTLESSAEMSTTALWRYTQAGAVDDQRRTSRPDFFVALRACGVCMRKNWLDTARIKTDLLRAATSV